MLSGSLFEFQFGPVINVITAFITLLLISTSMRILGELLTLFIADAFGGSGAAYWGPKTFTGGPHYVGPIVLMLALVAMWVIWISSVPA